MRCVLCTVCERNLDTWQMGPVVHEGCDSYWLVNKAGHTQAAGWQPTAVQRHAEAANGPIERPRNPKGEIVYTTA